MPWKLQPKVAQAEEEEDHMFRVAESDLPEDPSVTCWLDEAEDMYYCTAVTDLFSDYDGQGRRIDAPATEAMRHAEDSY